MLYIIVIETKKSIMFSRSAYNLHILGSFLSVESNMIN